MEAKTTVRLVSTLFTGIGGGIIIAGIRRKRTIEWLKGNGKRVVDLSFLPPQA